MPYKIKIFLSNMPLLFVLAWGLFFFIPFRSYTQQISEGSFQDFPGDRLYQEGLKLFEQYKYKEAILYFKEAIKKKPNFAEAHYQLALCYIKLLDYENARQNLISAKILGNDEKLRKETIRLLEKLSEEIEKEKRAREELKRKNEINEFEKTKDLQKDWTKKEIKGKYAIVRYPAFTEPYAVAFMKIIDTARESFYELYNIKLPQLITMEIIIDPSKKNFVRLHNDGWRTIYLEADSEEKLGAPLKSKCFNIYGICHEMGHMACSWKVGTWNFSPEVNEGWAHYFGSRITDEVYKKIGEDFYPEPHNYAEISGMFRLIRQFDEEKKDPIIISAKFLYELELKYGSKRLPEFLNLSYVEVCKELLRKEGIQVKDKYK